MMIGDRFHSMFLLSQALLIHIEGDTHPTFVGGHSSWEQTADEMGRRTGRESPGREN